MHRFDDDDPEPVAVVRTLSDFALALTLVVLMLIGTRSAAENRPLTEAHAMGSQLGPGSASLNLVLMDGRQFQVESGHGEQPGTAAALSQRWIAAHPNVPATIVLQFSQQTLATELHRALLDLQSAFGTNLARIDTVPQP